MEQVGVSLVADGERPFLNAIERADRAVSGFGDSAGRAASGGIDALSAASVAAGTVIGGVLFSALEKGAEAVAGFVGGTISKAGEFEATLNRFASVTGDAITEAGLSIEDFSDLFLKMGAVTQFSAGEAAEAAVELAKGGLDPLTIAAGGLEGALALAAAGELDLAEAAEIAAKQLGVWGDQGVVAADVADLMAQAANASTVNVDDLALGMANVGGVAKGVGASFEETVTMLALLAPGFGSASDAGTSLKTFFNSLIPTTDKATEAMEELGLWTEEAGSAFFDAEGNFIGAAETSRLLAEATAGLSEEQKSLALETIFGSDAQRAALGLAEAGIPGYQGMAAAMDAAGTAAEQAAERNKGWEFALESLRGSLDTVQTIIGLELIPVITDFINTAIIPAVNWIGELATKLGESQYPLVTLGEIVSEFSPLLGNLIFALDAFLSGAPGDFPWEDVFPPWLAETMYVISSNFESLTINFNAILGIVGGVVAGFASLTILTTVAGWVSGLVATWGALTAAVTASGSVIGGIVAILGGPVTVTIAAVAAGVALLTVAWNQNWGDIQGKTQAVWEFLQPTFEAVGEWLEVNIPRAVQATADFWNNTLQPALEAVWEFIESSVIPTIQNVAEDVLGALDRATETTSRVWNETLKPALEAVWEFVDTSLIPLFEAVAEVFNVTLTLALEAMTGLWQNVLLPALTDVWDFIDRNIMPILETLADFIVESVATAIEDKFIDPLRSLYELIRDSVSPTISGFKDNVVSPLAGIFDGVARAIDNVIGWLGDLAAAISGIELPDWLTPGSPTPFEMGLWGISDALKEVGKIDLPQLQAELSLSAGALVSPPGGRGGSVVNNYYNIEGSYNTAFTGNYGSQPGIRDRSDLAWLVARGA